jgi:DNA processing protein
MTAEVRDLLGLHLVPGLGPRLTAALLERFGSANAVRHASSAQLAEVPHVGVNLAAKFREAMDRVDVAAELALMERHRVVLLRCGVPPYPPQLETISVPPDFLYLRGALEERDAQAVAIVGSRHGTAYGLRVAERLAADLARAGFTIISGLARGTDAAAHRGALKAGGRTIAVLAGGLSKIYPPEHTELAEQVASAGALLTESPMRMEPMAGMFPARNRIISGLARAVVLVEAAEKSGALITASHAAEQGREVFAIPGPVDSPTSAGTLTLLRKGARLARHAADILEDLQGIAPIVTPAAPPPAPAAVVQAPPRNLEPMQQRIWDALASEPRHIDELTRFLSLPVADLSRMLMTLEMKRLVRRLPGNRFERA